jgi:uncharacterized protein YjbJ (UPF0337 family)
LFPAKPASAGFLLPAILKLQGRQFPASLHSLLLLALFGGLFVASALPLTSLKPLLLLNVGRSNLVSLQVQQKRAWIYDDALNARLITGLFCPYRPLLHHLHFVRLLQPPFQIFIAVFVTEHCSAISSGIVIPCFSSTVDQETSLRRLQMNKDQVKGAAKDIAGKIQREVGELTGDKEQQVKGLAKQAEGKVQKGVGDAKEAIKDAANKL